MVLQWLGAVGLQFVLRGGRTGILGVFVESLVTIANTVGVWRGSDGHLEILFTF